MQAQPSPSQSPERLVQLGVPCQLEAFPTQMESGPPGRDEPWSWFIRRRALGAWRRLARLVKRLAGTAPPAVAATTWPTLTLVAGDLVRVRPADQIRRSLDAKQGIKGCAFGDGMYQFCGRELRVVRVVHRFFDEGRYRMLRARDMVLLEGVHCDGSGLPETEGCDRQCYYFWRTEWLEKVPGQGDAPRP